MSGNTLLPPEPADVDETRSMELRRLSAHAGLRGRPTGTQCCENCAYYLENTADISYCWQPKLRIVVGATWWCQWWETLESDD